jgi:hypothetical protein
MSKNFWAASLAEENANKCKTKKKIQNKKNNRSKTIKIVMKTKKK